MGLWSTCYQVGPFLAGPFMGVLIVRYGWRSAFQVPALLMALVALLVLWLVVPGPGPPASEAPPAPAEEEAARRAAQRAVVRSPLLWSFGAAYFFIKFTRYALALWLPFYLSEQLGYDAAKSNAVASAFEGGGMFGVIALGALSDRLKVGRVPLSAISLLCLAAALFAAAKLVGGSTTVNVLVLALVGAFLFAPDSILCGAAAQDAGGRHAASMATGFVNGVGSIGAFIEGLSVPLLAKRFGWQALFPGLVGMAVLGAVCLLPALGVTARRQRA
jgi:sugar phosphate permease